ncbi:hypothetical protein VOLCADRAFT_99173 [Volvox carteri f. nagariensis]|uniref:Uncharacterized protein n=1 Tax=Volvox carteri f. nagariensis TaxID=3068 RepID=D8UH61_VOLCA|nr:uncharacterized protein VOLCADRAFT_99173 [Volvox carteri f. nagariensis]EFJ40923.1 hypothetical protein VOLCADRAFT_99173 [Volvox carteri f. nagariensis]|eukprot:XP_002957990.1 hypothetical protein VOLCADRAFT_99173 [Volvox carteri f. nagariensis]
MLGDGANSARLQGRSTSASGNLAYVLICSSTIFYFVLEQSAFLWAMTMTTNGHVTSEHQNNRPRKMGPTSSREWSRPRKMGPTSSREWSRPRKMGPTSSREWSRPRKMGPTSSREWR